MSQFRSQPAFPQASRRTYAAFILLLILGFLAVKPGVAFPVGINTTSLSVGPSKSSPISNSISPSKAFHILIGYPSHKYIGKGLQTTEGLHPRAVKDDTILCRTSDGRYYRIANAFDNHPTDSKGMLCGFVGYPYFERPIYKHGKLEEVVNPQKGKVRRDGTGETYQTTWANQGPEVAWSMYHSFAHFWYPYIVNRITDKITGANVGGPRVTPEQYKRVKAAKKIVKEWMKVAAMENHRNAVKEALKEASDRADDKRIEHQEKLKKEEQEMLDQKQKIELETEKEDRVRLKEVQWKLLSDELRLQLVMAHKAKDKAKAELHTMKHQIKADAKQRKKAAKDAHQPQDEAAEKAQKAADAQALLVKNEEVRQKRAEVARLKEEVRRNQALAVDENYLKNNFNMHKELKRLKKLSDRYRKDLQASLDHDKAMTKEQMEDNGRVEGIGT